MSKEPEKSCSEIAREIIDNYIENDLKICELPPNYDYSDHRWVMLEGTRYYFGLEGLDKRVTQALEREREKAKLKLPNATKDIARRLAKDKILADNVSNEYEKLVVIHKLIEVTDKLKEAEDNCVRWKANCEDAVDYSNDLEDRLTEAMKLIEKLRDALKPFADCRQFCGIAEHHGAKRALNQADKFLGEK